MLVYKIAANFGDQNDFLIGWLKKPLSTKLKNPEVSSIKNFLNQNCVAKNNLLVFIKKNSYKKPTLLFKLSNRFGVVKAFCTQVNNCLYVVSKTLTLLNVYLAAKIIFLGLQKKFKTKLVLHGLRIRVDKIYKKCLILKLNLAHKIKWKNSKLKFFKFRKAKNSFFFKSNNILLHNIFLFTIRKFKMPDIYKGSGIRFFKEKIKFKKRKQFGAF